MVAQPVSDLLQQAHHGSISAIIQVLNDRLTDDGVRTRAVFEHGVLQLLCEAATPAHLDRSFLVHKVSTILEDISPRKIRRVSINARLIQEQQLLWLEEIRKDPARQLLWSQEIQLSRPYLVRYWLQDAKQTLLGLGAQRRLSQSDGAAHQSPQHRSFQRGIVSGVVVTMLLGILSGGGYLLWRRATQPTGQSAQQRPASGRDGFAEAVRLAEAAAGAAKSAKTSQDWQAIGQKWDQASQLMAQVSPTDARYKTAQDRTVRYRKNQAIALKHAQKNQRP
jgi:hypothetical protein